MTYVKRSLPSHDRVTMVVAWRTSVRTVHRTSSSVGMEHARAASRIRSAGCSTNARPRCISAMHALGGHAIPVNRIVGPTPLSASLVVAPGARLTRNVRRSTVQRSPATRCDIAAVRSIVRWTKTARTSVMRTPTQSTSAMTSCASEVTRYRVREVTCAPSWAAVTATVIATVSSIMEWTSPVVTVCAGGAAVTVPVSLPVGRTVSAAPLIACAMQPYYAIRRQ